MKIGKAALFLIALNSLNAKEVLENQPGFSLTLPKIASSKDAVIVNQKNATATLLPEKQFLSKAERKELRKKLDTITYRKDAKKLSAELSREAANLCIQLEWYNRAVMYLKEIIKKSKDSEEIRKLKLEIADIHFENGNLKKAETFFAEYLDLYPGSEQTEYVHYKRTLCLFYQTLKVDQDQGPTRQAIELADAYLEKGLAFKKYRDDIREIRTYCYNMLYQNEAVVFDFYMKKNTKKSLTAAENRLAYIKTEYQTKLPAIEPEVIRLEIRLAQAQGKKEVYNERLAYLEKKYPEQTKSARLAKTNTKKAYINRF